MNAEDTVNVSRGRVRLALICIAIACVWCWLLPRLAQTDTVRKRSNWLEERGIDPAAMYYTDLPLLEPVLQRIEGRRMEGKPSD